METHSRRRHRRWLARMPRVTREGALVLLCDFLIAVFFGVLIQVHFAEPPSDRLDVPPFGYSVHPVSRIPDWGAMRSPAEWNRLYGEIPEEEWIPVPRYDLAVLTEPLASLIKPLRPENIPAITAKLYYSTRHFGCYDLDAGEFTGSHAGVDLKLPRGTPVGAIGGGRVHAVMRHPVLGLTVIIEHVLPDDGTYFSVYGHLDASWVEAGDSVRPGARIGRVGMSGQTTAAHLHLQVDRDTGVRPHRPYLSSAPPAPDEAGAYGANPILFILAHARTS